MPWQAQLFIGQRVHNWDEVRAIYKKFGHVLSEDDLELEETQWDLPTIPFSFNWDGEQWNVHASFRREPEGGCPFPVDKLEDYSDAAIVFDLTSRYKGAILDGQYEHGRPEPFEFEVEDVLHILNQVRKKWPEAKAIIWDKWY